MFFKLAMRNVRRQIGSYLIYFITVSLTIALVFSVNNMIYSDMMEDLIEQFNEYVRPALLFVSCVLCFIMAFVLGYATQFLLRKRKKEYGLYLTMGMSRKDILSIFAGEIAITFIISLLFGIAAGLGIYQAIMVIFADFIDYIYTPGGYSLAGFSWTIFQVGGIFVVAAAISLVYLRVTKISALLQGTETGSKKVLFPGVWIAVLIGSAAVLIISAVSFLNWIQAEDFALHLGELTYIVIGLMLSLFFLPVSLIKVLFWLLLKKQCCSAHRVGRFTLRQLSSRLNSNSLMIGAISLLLAVAIVGPNICYTMNTMIDTKINSQYLYDIFLSSSSDYYQGDYGEQLEIIEEYADIDRYCLYKVYEGSSGGEEAYVKESDFKELCALSGYQAPDLNGGYLYCSQPMFYDGGWFEFTPQENGEKGCIGTLVCPAYFLAGYSFAQPWYVVPDGAAPEGTDYCTYLAIYLKSNDYDAVALREILYGQLGEYKYNAQVKERERLYQVRSIGLFLLGGLYLAAAFSLLSVALLALKVLSMVTEERGKYRVMWKLGASKRMLKQSLFIQMFLLFFMPFFAPLLLNIPLFSVVQIMFMNGVGNFSATAAVYQLVGLSGALLGVFALYFIVSYIITWHDLKKHLRTEIRS